MRGGRYSQVRRWATIWLHFLASSNNGFIGKWIRKNNGTIGCYILDIARPYLTSASVAVANNLSPSSPCNLSIISVIPGWKADSEEKPM